MAEMAKRARVTGRVQRVGFRVWVQDRADRLGLDGWVRNEPDGSVLALVSGEAERVERMLVELRDGPLGSGVAGVMAEDAVASAGAGFSIRR